MSKQNLNHFYIETGTWTEGQANLIDTRNATVLNAPNTVVIHETAHSGHVLITRSGESKGSHGHGGGHDLSVNVHSGPTTIVVPDTQIYVNIVMQDETSELISAPLRTSLEFNDVTVIELHIVFQIGPPGWKKAEYSTLVNAHIVYEIK